MKENKPMKDITFQELEKFRNWVSVLVDEIEHIDYKLRDLEETHGESTVAHSVAVKKSVAKIAAKMVNMMGGKETSTDNVAHITWAKIRKVDNLIEDILNECDRIKHLFVYCANEYADGEPVISRVFVDKSAINNTQKLFRVLTG